MNWKIALQIFLCIFVWKILRNLSYLIQTHILKFHFDRYLKNEKNTAETSNKKFQKLMQKADIKDRYLPTAAPIPGGKMAAFSASVFEAFPTADEIASKMIIRLFNTAIGCFKDRIWESLSPFYWIELVLWAHYYI